ncbi:aldo/keto reductase [Natrialba aegyptia]|uniref:Aldehyde reductase n=1 Tax=Natrialba aegyptia DSM 13077 TaxID=1227491 RepID=M0AM59_9EURY|nr:aldo/keto reductase [Natrialba aegyptia]ELY99624.1 aldehyde reductase [Natrialba aegyptia DSM 13077]
METVTLNNDVEMPILGFGTYQIDDLEVCERSVSDALRTGYRLIDTAAGYENEEAVGRAIETSDVAREDVFVTTKLWIQDAGYESTKRAFERSLDRLGLDYLDLYLIHQPFGDVHGSWQAMEDLYHEDKIRAIGVSNFHPDRLIDLIVHNEVVPAVNQIETHPFYQRTEDAEFMSRHEIQHESWGPFAEGRNNLFENDVLVSIGEQYSKSAAQVVLRWLIQRGIVAIPKSVHEERIVENFDIFGFELSTEDMNTISELNEFESLFPDHRDPEFVKQLSEVEANT